MNDPYGSDWLTQSDILDEIKEESVEIKEEPFDDMKDFTSENFSNYASDDVKNESVKIKENFDDFVDVKEEEPIIDEFNAIGNESVKVKEEFVDDFVDAKEEELSTLPVADVFCPSTGHSRPLSIDIDKGMHSRSQIPVPTIIKATKRLHRKCAFCDPFHKMGSEMEDHVRTMHPEEFAKLGILLKKCAFCDSVYRKGDVMDQHVRLMHPDSVASANSTVVPKRRGRSSKDEQLAADNNLPISSSEIVDMPRAEFMKLLESDSLTELQRELIWKIRKRGQNRVAYRKSLVSAALRIGPCRPKRPHKGRPSKDEELAVANGLPFSAAEITDMARAEFSKLRESDSLTELQRELIWKIRKRGHNRKFTKGRNLSRTKNVTNDDNTLIPGIIE